MTGLVDIGIIVYDKSYGMTGVIVEKNPVVMHHENDSTWDWGILYEDGQIGYADNLELEVVDDK